MYNTPEVVVHAAEAFGGGVLHVVEAYANATAEAGVATVVIHGRRPQTPTARQLRRLFAPDVELIEIPEWGRRDVCGGVRSATRALRSLAREVKSTPSGIMHLHSSCAGALGRLIAVPQGWRVYYSPHAYAFLGPRSGSAAAAIRGTERLLAGRATTVAVSNEEAEVARKLGATEVVVIRNGVDPLVPSKAPRRPASPRVCVIGRAETQRAPDVLCEAAAELGDIEIVWVGDGDWRDRLAACGVRVTGWLSRDDAASEIVRASTVVHLARYDGLPLALVEAMTAGKPIVAMDGRVAREVLSTCAVFVSTPSELAAAVRTLISDPERAAVLGSAARRRALTVFSRSQMVGTLLETYGLKAAIRTGAA